MESLLLLLLILALFLLPSFLQMRAQRKRLNEIRQVQQSLVAGDIVVTSSGIYGRVLARTGETVTLEIAPGVVTTWEVIAIERKVDPAAPSEPTAGAESAEQIRDVEDPAAQRPEYEHSENPQHPENTQRPEDERP